jgi:hypothetical protein
MDIGIAIAIIGAGAALVAATLAFVLKVVSDARDRRRRAFAHLMALRSEILVNTELARLMLTNHRLAGLKFVDRVWILPDTSSIYVQGLPWAEVVTFYAQLAMVNLLIDRRNFAEKYSDDTMKTRLAVERVETMRLVENIAARGSAAAAAIEKRTGLTSNLALNLTGADAPAG